MNSIKSDHAKLVRDLSVLLNNDEGGLIFESNRAAMKILSDHGYDFPEYDEDEFCAMLIQECADWDMDGYWIKSIKLQKFLEAM